MGRRFYYYFCITEYHLRGTISPLESVKNRIKAIILHKRKLTLANKIQKEIIQKAEKQHHYEVYKIQ